MPSGRGNCRHRVPGDQTFLIKQALLCQLPAEILLTPREMSGWYLLVSMPCYFISDHNIFHKPLGIQPWIIMSNLHCGQFSQVLALQIKQSVSEETETKQHVGGVNYYRTCSDRNSEVWFLFLTAWLALGFLVVGCFTWFCLFACFVKYYFDRHREHQLNWIFQLNFIQCTQHTCKNQSRITSLFSNRRGYDTSHSCNIKTVLSIPCTKELSVILLCMWLNIG